MKPYQKLHSAAAATLLLFSFSVPSNSQAENTVIVASATNQSRVAAVAEIIMGRAYMRLGYKLKVSNYPGKRALYKSNSGETDAELVRIASIVEKYPNLVQVPEAIFNVNGMAFSWNSNMRFGSDQDLWGRRIGYVRGIQWAEKVVQDNSVKIATNVHHLFQLLANRQIDIALEAQLTGRPELRHFPDRGLVMLNESPIHFPVFHFLNKKHRNLITPLAAEILKLKKRGVIRQIFQNYYKNAKSGHN